MLKHILVVSALIITLFANNYERGDEAYEEGDIKKAVTFWKTGAKYGEVDSQFMLGFLYLQGEDIPLDTQKAATLLAKAFDHGSETIRITIALAYYKNKAHAPADIKALEQFEKAIDKQGRIAQYNLGMLFITGDADIKNMKKGAALIKKAKDAGLLEAKEAWSQYNLKKYI